ncbi:hypothetical protein [Planctomonas psychrotolerans]|uniref:hypothetical protein n=1 Tax=Planctomonas psychrotolerans TaxID=2528712 RepID=UPI001239BBD0|nr:hypothetical protein [Planctomonas psychrotolerans]
MSEHNAVPGGRDRSTAQRRRALIWGGVALLLIVLVIVAIVASLTRRGTPDDAVTPTPNGTPAASASPTPSPSETPTEAPTPEETASAEPAPEAEQPNASAEVVEATEENPAAFDETSEAAPGVRVEVGELTAVEGEPRGAGELAGPALRLTVNVTNTGPEPANLDSLVVNLYYGEDERPAPSVSGPNVFNVPAEAAPGATVTGAYVFTVPEDQRDTVRVAVDYSTDVDLVVFQGAAPR